MKQKRDEQRSVELDQNLNSTTNADDTTSSSHNAKPDVVCCFSFKSKTLDGRSARIETIAYDNDVVIISKIIVSIEDLSSRGFTRIKKFKNFGVYQQVMSLLTNSLFNITNGIIDGVALK